MSEADTAHHIAVIAAPASVAMVYLGDWVLAIVLSVLAALGAWEFYRMARETGAWASSLADRVAALAADRGGRRG